MGRFNSLLIHGFSGRAWRKLQAHVLVAFIYFRLSWEGAGWEEGRGQGGGRRTGWELVHPPGYSGNESQEIVLQKRKDRSRVPFSGF